MAGTLNVAAPRSERDGRRGPALIKRAFAGGRGRGRAGERALSETYARVLRNIAAVMYILAAMLPRVR